MKIDGIEIDDVPSTAMWIICWQSAENLTRLFLNVARKNRKSFPSKVGELIDFRCENPVFKWENVLKNTYETNYPNPEPF